MPAANSLVTRARRATTVPFSLEFETVYSDHFAYVWRCLRGLGVADASLDDATQEVFMVVLRRLADFNEDRASMRTWLYGIIRNVANNQRRSQKRRPTGVLSPDLELPSSAPGPDEHIAEQELANFAHAFLLGLDEPRRHIFLLVMLEEISVPEVARMLAIPVNTAYSRLRDLRLDFERALRRRKLVP